MENFISSLSSYIWSMPVIVFIIGAGIFFSFKNKFYQLFGFGKVLKQTVIPHKTDKKTYLREFRSMSLVLASCLGTGNITGVASALISGGAGAVFWMWVSAFFGMITSYTENVYGFRTREFHNGSYFGGGMYYLRTINLPTAVVYGVLCTLCSFSMGNAVQTGTMSSVLKDAFGINRRITGIVLTILLIIIVWGGAKRLFELMGRLIPFAALFYILASLVLIIRNFERIPQAFTEIFTGAFGLRGITGGISGIAVKKSVDAGLRRGVFSNEAGLGVSPMAHAPANMKNENIQGSWGIFEVFFDTIVICSLTAFAILCSDVWKNGSFFGEDILVNAVFGESFGNSGKMLVAVAITIFAFMTLAGWSFYGEQAYTFVFGGRSRAIYKTVYVLLIPLFAVVNSGILWTASDVFNGLMMIINIGGILVLSLLDFKKKSVI